MVVFDSVGVLDVTFDQFQRAVACVHDAVGRTDSRATALAALLWVVAESIEDDTDPPGEVIALKALAEVVSFRILQLQLSDED